MNNMAEKKFFDYTGVTPFTSTVAWITASDLFRIVNGNAATQRIGNRIFLHSVEWIVHCTCITAQIPNNGEMSRMIVWHNKEAAGTLPAGTDLFVQNLIGSARNSSTLPRYQVLRDMMCPMVSTTATTSGPVYMSRMKIFPRKMIDYQLNGTSQADILKHDYGVGFASKTAGTCTFYYTVKFTFSDA